MRLAINDAPLHRQQRTSQDNSEYADKHVNGNVPVAAVHVNALFEIQS